MRTSSAEIPKQQTLKAERRQLTSCRETPAQLRLGARSRVSPDVRADHCDGQEEGQRSHLSAPLTRSVLFQQHTVVSAVSGLGRQAEEGRDVLQHVAEKHRFRFNPGLKRPAAASPSRDLEQ